MNRLLVNGIIKGKGVGSMFQRQSIIPNNRNGTMTLRSLDSKIRDREIALEDEYVRRTEKERTLRKRREYRGKKSKKSMTLDRMLLSNKAGTPIGRLSDSGIIF
ncbi:hypothetical protein RB653_002846 [Dictyostelium firmibasis]|uniref:Uncharacterized protein n=1 Tax=Dictyostelium firmibasis TaxID=79012 RepID=A0AAN7TYI0_9MYCE